MLDDLAESRDAARFFGNGNVSVFSVESTTPVGIQSQRKANETPSRRPIKIARSILAHPRLKKLRRLKSSSIILARYQFSFDESP